MVITCYGEYIIYITNRILIQERRNIMGSEYIGNGYGQSKAGGCVGGVGCLADVGCGGNACGAAACGANVCGVDGCGVAACGINACPLNGCVGDACAANFTPLPGPFSNSDNK